MARHMRKNRRYHSGFFRLVGAKIPNPPTRRILLRLRSVPVLSFEKNPLNSHGHKIGENSRSFWGGTNHYGPASMARGSSIVDEYDVIQNEIVDGFTDADDAAEWLEDNGYDPDDFDF